MNGQASTRGRLDSLCHEASANLVNFAMRQQVTEIHYDDSNREFVAHFPYDKLKQYLGYKADEAGINFLAHTPEDLDIDQEPDKDPDDELGFHCGTEYRDTADTKPKSLRRQSDKRHTAENRRIRKSLRIRLERSLRGIVFHCGTEFCTHWKLRNLLRWNCGPTLTRSK